MALHAFTTSIPTVCYPDGLRCVGVVAPLSKDWRSRHRAVAARIRQTTTRKVSRATHFQYVNVHGVTVVQSYWT